MSPNDLYDVTLQWYGRKKNLEKINEKKEYFFLISQKKEYKKVKIKLSFPVFFLVIT